MFVSASGKYLIAGLGYGGKDQDIYDIESGKLPNTYRGNVPTKHADTYQFDGKDFWVFVGSGGKPMLRKILTFRNRTVRC